MLPEPLYGLAVRKAALTVEEAGGPGQFLSAHYSPSLLRK
jgi:hypothetical protein